MNGLKSVLTFFIYIITDLITTIIPFGFYSNQKFHFSFDQIVRQLFMLDGYNFTKSPFDFVILLIFRIISASIGIFCKLSCPDCFGKKSSLFVLGFFIFNWTITLIKLLAFSEDPNFWKIEGIWMSLAFSTISALALSALWQFVYCSNTIPNYQTLINELDGILQPESTESARSSSRKGAFEHSIRLLSYCKNQWRWYTAGFIFLILYSASRVFVPSYTGQVVSSIVQSKERAVLIHAVMLISLLTLMSTFFGGLRGGCFDYATALVHRQMRSDLFRAVVYQEIAFFDATKSGEIVSRLTADCQKMSSTVALNINVFLRNGIMLIGGLVFMFTLSWRLSMITFLTIPIVIFITKLFGSIYDKLSEKTQSTIAAANHLADEVINTIRTVRSFACEMREAIRFDDRLSVTLAVNKKKSCAYVVYTWANEFCDNAILVGVLFYGGHLVMSGNMSVDKLIAFLFYQLQLGENLYSMGYVFTGLMESVGASRKVFEYMNRVPNISSNGTQKCLEKGEIRFDRVTFWYPSRPNNIVLKEISFHILPGETVALVGPSGGGKSSIVSLIEHFYDVNDGCIYIDNFPVAEYDHYHLHEKIALVAQEPVLFEGTVRYNILYGSDSRTEEEMIASAKMANIHDFIIETEHGYDTNCGEKGVQMSGGQKQRIAIARALVRKPAVLVLDEATSALDAESEHLVQEALSWCARERTVIIIAHRLSTVEKADRIIVIEKGEVVQQGRHRELLAEEGIYKSLIERQLFGQKQTSDEPV